MRAFEAELLLANLLFPQRAQDAHRRLSLDELWHDLQVPKVWTQLFALRLQRTHSRYWQHLLRQPARHPCHTPIESRDLPSVEDCEVRESEAVRHPVHALLGQIQVLTDP